MFNKKSQIKCVKDFKLTLPCYDMSKDRFLESLRLNNGKEISFDCGHKYDLKTLDSKNLKERAESKLVFKIKNFETPYKKVLGEFESYRKIQINSELLKILKQGFELKNFFRARILNNTKKGFSVGVCGVVGFLAINNSVKVRNDKAIIVYIESFDIPQGMMNLSQKNIHKKTSKVLLKLSSRIMFVFNSNEKQPSVKN